LIKGTTERVETKFEREDLNRVVSRFNPAIGSLLSTRSFPFDNKGFARAFQTISKFELSTLVD
jgi:hypothetical protein